MTSTAPTRQDGLTQDSPFIRRFWAWVQERFPVANALLFLALYAAALVTGAALSAPGHQEPLALSAAHLAGFLGVWGYFLLLRVYDEHKDYAQDALNYPQRVLQSGLITLKHLKGVGVLAVLAQLATTLALGQGAGPALWAWLLVMLWSALMAKEFFIGAWLERRLVLYALSHMIVMPMALVWMAHLGAKGQWLTPALAWLAASSFASGAAFEVTRKTRAPEEERDTVDSYARVLGLRPACAVILIFLAASALCQIGLLTRTLERGPGPLWSALCLAPLLLPAAQLTRFMRRPALALRKANEASVALAMLAGYLILIAATLTERGLTLTLTP